MLRHLPFMAGLLLLLCQSCNSRADQIGYGKETFPCPPLQTEPASVSYPATPVSLPDSLRRVIDQAEELRDLVELDHFVKLEVTDQSVIAEVRGLMHFKNCLYILDDQQNMVFQFTDNGSFVRRISQLGQGPGEFQEPRGLLHDQDHLIIVDTQDSTLLYFDLDGNHVRTVETKSQYLWLTSSVLFKDQVLYAFDYFALNGQAPYAAIVDVSKSTPVIRSGFGDRFEFMDHRLRTGKSTWGQMGYNFVDDMIWAGSPCSGDIEVYDLDGRLAGVLKPGFDTVQYEDFDEVTNEEDLNQLFRKSKRYGVFPLGDLALVSYTDPKRLFAYNVYDRHGNLLKRRLDMSHAYFKCMYSDGVNLYATFPVDIEHLEFYQKYLTKDEFVALEASGWDKGNWLDDNVYIAVGRLKEI